MRIVHFEIPADDPARAIKFYQSAFGWSFDKWEGPMEYWMVKTGDGPGIDGGLMRRAAPGQGQNNVVAVPSVDDITGKIVQAGGTLVASKMAVPGVGWTAYFADPEGNAFGVMEFNPSAA
jgi:predicted enzyme related to lactoylglutathione lyase